MRSCSPAAVKSRRVAPANSTGRCELSSSAIVRTQLSGSLGSPVHATFAAAQIGCSMAEEEQAATQQQRRMLLRTSSIDRRKQQLMLQDGSLEGVNREGPLQVRTHCAGCQRVARPRTRARTTPPDKRCMADWLASNEYFLACWQETVPCVTQQVATCALHWTLLWTVANALACIACMHAEGAGKQGGRLHLPPQ